MRLVVCDDHQLLLEALTSALTQAGHEVVAATMQPDMAVEAVRGHKPDACLLDLSFPGASGMTVIAAVHAANPSTRVVILSGTADETLVAEAVRLGAHGFVGKHRSMGDIVATLEQAVGDHPPVLPTFEAGAPSSPTPPSAVAPRRPALHLARPPLHSATSGVPGASGFAGGRPTDWSKGAANGHANVEPNGHANGHANVEANGHANVEANGHANGHSNGHSNGQSDGAAPRLSAAARGQLNGSASSPSTGSGQSARNGAGNGDPLWVLRFLTEREWQVLHCILDGRSTEQMAAELGVRRSTARTHVQNLLTKLGVHSRLQVAALMSGQTESSMRQSRGAS